MLSWTLRVVRRFVINICRIPGTIILHTHAKQEIVRTHANTTHATSHTHAHTPHFLRGTHKKQAQTGARTLCTKTSDAGTPKRCRLVMAEPPAPASLVSSWISKIKANMTPALTADAPSLPPAPPQPASETVTVSVSAAASADAPLPPEGKPWDALRSMWKKASEIGAEVIRLDPPEHFTATAPSIPAPPVAEAAPAPPPLPAAEAAVEDNETAGLLTGRLKMPGVLRDVLAKVRGCVCLFVRV